MARLLVVAFILVKATRSQECYNDGSDFCIDQDDILSADLLPGSFLLMDQYYSENMSRSADLILTDGTFGHAFDEMEFHRKRMNEYLCHGYMAEEIVREVGSVRVKRRNDEQTENTLQDFSGEPNVTVHDKLLFDEGSSKYKDWLHRTTTLDDVYRHYAPTHKHKSIKKKHEVHEDPESDGEFSEFEGELYGYTKPVPISTGKMGRPGLGQYGGPIEDHLVESPTGYGYPSYGPPPNHGGGFMPTVHEQHIYLPGHDDDDEEDYHHAPVYHKGKGHDLSIRDFFEIALTALAFLAFGLFIIQLLMNITNPATMMTTTASMVPEIDQRFRRHVLDTGPLAYGSGNEELNELAQRVLRSIEAVLVAQADAGNCLRRTLCEDNRYSRETSGGRRIWIPVWSLGMSWASGRVLGRDRWSAILESVKASVLGLGRADCATLYPDCQLGRERVKRRRRRRK